MTGRLKSPSRRRSRHSVRPSDPGIITSSTATSIWPDSNSCRAWVPSCAIATSSPSRSRYRRTTSRTTVSSSAISTRVIASEASRRRPAELRCHGSVTVLLWHPSGRPPTVVAMTDREPALVTVVLPCLNEQNSLAGVLAAIPNGYRALVVDNNSTDDTASVARRHGADVISESRAGYGSAVHAGIVAATTPLVAVI